MDLHQTLLFQKIQRSNTIVFADFDGTVFTPRPSIVTTPFFNLQTKNILTKNNIPLVFVTGRPGWSTKAEIETTLCGLPKADAIIAGAGTIIYYRLPDGELEIDTQWEQLMQQSTITWKDGATERWNREKIQSTIIKITDIPFTLLPLTSDKHLIRLYVRSLPIDTLQLLTNNIRSLFSKGIKVLITEKLLQPNSLTTFSGNILIIPEKAGKDLAVKYILDKIYRKGLQIPSGNKGYLRVLIFGDASIDIPMLTLKSSEECSIQSFGVNLTPLAKHSLTEKLNDNPQLKLLNSDGPKAILEVLKQLQDNNFRPKPNHMPEQVSNLIRNGTSDYGLNISVSSRHRYQNHVDGIANPVRQEPAGFTPAQNSLARRLIEPFEPILDNILDKKLSPNDISLLGVDMVKKSIDILYGEKHITFSQKLTAIKQYFFGNFIDLLDGIRYRQNKKASTVFSSPIRRGPRSGGEVREPQDYLNQQDLPGQLVDVYCDRIKEFYQLYKRAIFRRSLLTKGDSLAKEQYYHTLLTAMSCILPSTARAQAEVSGAIVQERDPKGGSMFTRTRKLFFSLLTDTFGFSKQSLSIDKKIYETNIVTFRNRISQIPSTFRENNSELQHKAQERFLLLVQLLQEENGIVEKKLQNYPEYLGQYKKEFKENIITYLDVDIEKQRKEWNIQKVDLHIKI